MGKSIQTHSNVMQVEVDLHIVIMFLLVYVLS